MSNLGKWLVFVNLVLSLVFVAWAVGLATNQIPWHTPTSSDGTKVQGMVAVLQDEIKRLAAARDAADARWAEGYLTVKQLEAIRPADEQFYATLFRSVRDGGAGIEPPVQQLAFVQTGLQRDQQGRLVLSKKAVQIDGQDALPVAGYRKAIQTTISDIQKAQADVKRLVAETEALTKQITGTRPRGEATTAEEKGLRVQLTELDETVHALKQEQEYLHSPLTYVTLQRDQLRRRHAALAARLDELRTATALRQ